MQVDLDPDAPRWLGRYELIRVLGQGASGRVTEAVLHGPRGFRKRVAVKLLHPTAALDGDLVSQLVHEARFGAMLSHPNVVSTLELGQVDGVWFVAMELVKGKSLSQLLRAGPLPPAALLDVGIQACAALTHVHELVEDGRPLQLVHRDVKPGNLLVDTTGNVRLADFGVAGIAAEVHGVTSGTPGYMAPEQIDGRAEPRSDLFALGMTLLSCAAGVNPLGRGVEALSATVNIERSLRRDGFLTPAERAVPGLGDVLYTALRYDPDLRWPHARTFARALRELRSGATGPSLAELSIAEPASTPEPAAPRTIPTVHRRDPPLVGRADAVNRVFDAIGRAGIVTVVGPGGVGKTRLVAEVVQRAAERDGSGRTPFGWCELVSCRTLTEVCVAVANALGTDLRDGDPVEQIGRVLALRGRSTVVLDNLEQALDVAAPAIARWSTLAPSLTLLCTSRAPLRVVGEERIEVPPLGPSDGEALFAALRGRPVEPAERAPLLELLRRVDGLPLAIELVAVRSKIVPVATLLERFDDRLRLTAAGPRTSDPRHRTLQATIRWSWELLGPDEQRAATQLAVLEGPFPLEVAEALCGRDVDQPTIDVLSTLVEHHLLRVHGDRFEWLELVRAYARRELEASGGLEAVERRHGEHFASWGSIASRRALRRPGGAARLRALCEAQPELVAACRRAVRRGDAHVAVPTSLAAAEVTLLVGPAPSGLALCDEVLALSLTPMDRGLVQERRGELLEIVTRREEALAAYDDAFRWFERIGDRERANRIVARIGGLLRVEGRFDEATAHLERALSEARAAGHRYCEALALNSLGLLLRDQGRPEEALRHLTAALGVYRAAGDRRGEGASWVNVAIVHRDLGAVSLAEAAYSEGSRALREVGDRRAEAIGIANLGVLALSVGDLPTAASRLEAAIAIHRRFGALHSLAIALGNLGIVLRELGRPDEAAQRYEEAEQLHRQADDRRGVATVLGNLAQLDAEAGNHELAAARFEEALALHRANDNPRSESIVLVNRGRAALDRGDVARATADLDAALEVATRTGERALVGSAHVALGRLARLTGRTLDAVRHLAAAQDQLDGIPTALSDLVEVRAELGLTAVNGSAAVARAELAAAEQLLGQRRLARASAVVAELRAAVARASVSGDG